jgi:hypothetical protein
MDMATSVTNLPSRDGGWGFIQLLDAGTRKGKKGKKSCAKHLVSGSYCGNEEGIARQANQIMEECVGSRPNPTREVEDGEGGR